MFIYGSEASFEWGFADDDDPVITTAQRAEDGRRGGTTSVEARVMPNFYEMLPREIQKHTVGGNYDPLNPQDSLISGAAGGHHGSHPHLVNEFLKSILEDRNLRAYFCHEGRGGGCGAGVLKPEFYMVK